MANSNEQKHQRESSQSNAEYRSLNKELIHLDELPSIGFCPILAGFQDDELNFLPRFFEPLSRHFLNLHPLKRRTTSWMPYCNYVLPAEEYDA